MEKLVNRIRNKLRKVDEKNAELALLVTILVFACFTYFFENKSPNENKIVVILSMLYLFLFPIRNLYKSQKKEKGNEKQ